MKDMDAEMMSELESTVVINLWDTYSRFVHYPPLSKC